MGIRVDAGQLGQASIALAFAGGRWQMPRKATSPDEISQIARVRTLLSVVGVAPSRELVVTIANGKKLTGHLVRDLVANKPGRKDSSRVYWGAITLATKDGNVEVDYLDIVWLQEAGRQR
jgi:hypothetical protein